MPRFSMVFLTLVLFACLERTAQAQWGWVQPVQPVFVAPAPVVHVHRPPVVVYYPRTVVHTRHRPILGGTVTRARRGYHRVVF